MPPLTQYVLMAWYLVKHRNNFTFTLGPNIIFGALLSVVFILLSAHGVTDQVSRPFNAWSYTFTSGRL